MLTKIPHCLFSNDLENTTSDQPRTLARLYHFVTGHARLWPMWALGGCDVILPMPTNPLKTHMGPIWTCWLGIYFHTSTLITLCTQDLPEFRGTTCNKWLQFGKQFFKYWQLHSNIVSKFVGIMHSQMPHQTVICSIFLWMFQVAVHPDRMTPFALQSSAE